MDHKIIQECEELSAQTKITFPKAVQKLTAAGVERYYVDLIKRRNTYYGNGRESVDVPFSVGGLPAVPQAFNPEAVQTAVKNIQTGQIDYPAFIKNIMDAGTCAYLACLTGRRVAYIGRNGDMHIEYFQPAK